MSLTHDLDDLTRRARRREFEDGLPDLRAGVAAVGVATAVIYLGMGINLRFGRYLVVGLVGGALSAALFFTPLTSSTSWLLLAASGGWALRRTRASLRAAP